MVHSLSKCCHSKGTVRVLKALGKSSVVADPRVKVGNCVSTKAAIMLRQFSQGRN